MSTRRFLTHRQLHAVFRGAILARRNPKLKGKGKSAQAQFSLIGHMSLPVRAWRHFCLVNRHKFWVFAYCCRAGIPFRGFMHDWSKYSVAEFWESVKYFNGRRSPVGLCREIEGYSYAWLHHKGRNRHHFEFWIDVVDSQGNTSPTPGFWYSIPMPYEYALESICDTIAASRAYNGPKFSYEVLYRWWTRRNRVPLNMHPATKRFADAMYDALRKDGSKALGKAREIFDAATREFENAK